MAAFRTCAWDGIGAAWGEVKQTHVKAGVWWPAWPVLGEFVWDLRRWNWDLAGGTAGSFTGLVPHEVEALGGCLWWNWELAGGVAAARAHAAEL